MAGGGTGRFWCVGVGPGDPELLTLKAVRILQQVAVVYHAGPRDREGRAWRVIQGFLRPDQHVSSVLTEPMRAVSAAEDLTPYQPAVERIAADCRRGLDVAFVTEGDPTLYSTAIPVWQLLREIAPEVAIEIVPGVTSVTAAAARVAWPLVRKEESLAVAPAGYRPDELRDLIHRFDSVCLLKVSQALPQLVTTLATFGSGREAVYLENLGMPQEWVTHDLAEAAGRGAYFALVLVRKTERRTKGSECRTALQSRPDGSGEPSYEPAPTYPPGKVWVVGLGPGDPSLLTEQAKETLRNAEVLVGYDPYLRSLASLGLRGELRGSPIGAERERARLALDLAATGQRVVLVSSGDAGVYGMASLLLETAEALPQVQVEVVPGVTAALAAAALLGAPLGHDFACVSLSDLLTPWQVIERRLHAAGQGDYVLALYNPRSERRTWQLPRARDILCAYRSLETPVGIVEKAWRPGTRWQHTTLGELTPDGITMETTVIIGSSQTRMVHGRMVTPRGYEKQP